MSRNGSGVYSLPAGSIVANGDTATASQHNTPLEDLESDMNTARPVVAGGTGATSAADARTNLEVPKAVYESHGTGTTASYRVIGTTLECWGTTGNMTGGGISISFPKTFARAPAVTLTQTLASAPGATEVYTATVDTITTTSVAARGRYHSGGSEVIANSPVCWHAIGEWDGVS